MKKFIHKKIEQPSDITKRTVTAYIKGRRGFNHSANENWNQAHGMLDNPNQTIMRQIDRAINGICGSDTSVRSFRTYYYNI